MTRIAVCSPRIRPSVQNNRSRFGHQWWKRDVYHLKGADGRTLCGRDCSDWLVIGPVEQIDGNCCTQCAAKTESTVSTG